MPIRKLQELIDTENPALPLLLTWASTPNGNSGILLPPSNAVRAVTLEQLQVTTRSMLGTIIYETGGVSIANGLIRLLGSGAERSLQQIHAGLGLPFDGIYPEMLIVGDDMLGGLFALNGGRFGKDRLGQVFHLAADDTIWIPLDVGYADFVSWCLNGNLSPLYEPFTHLEAYGKQPRPGFNLVYSFYPFLWTKEGKGPGIDVRLIDADGSLRSRIHLCGFATEALSQRLKLVQ
jgi:hypothetical protein